MLLLIIFIMFVAPLCTLLHEIGHGLGVAATSKSDVHIYLGRKSTHNKENFKLGRFRFHIQWSFAAGFTQWEKGLQKKQRIIALAGGPIMSLVLVFIFGMFSTIASQEELRQLLQWATTFNVIQFIVTTIPIYYPSWMMGAKGIPSDGLQIMRLLRE